MLRALTLRAPVIESDPDAELVAAAQADTQAFALLYERYKPRIYRYLVARAASAEDAADLTQAVFLKAFDGLPRFRPGNTPFSSWLFRIARNAAVDAHRRRRPTVALEALATSEPESPLRTEDGSLRDERIVELRRLVATLDSDKRDLLALRYAGGLSAAEIAPFVGKSPEAVKKQLQRTLRHLKEHYRDHE